jgi:hypothetical protein
MRELGLSPDARARQGIVEKSEADRDEERRDFRWD